MARSARHGSSAPTTTPMAGPRAGAPRRSPSGAQRQRDAERTRERILDAALVEFGEHGFAGARTGAIAQRAGVNQQLISYYFNGKAGLYGAVSRRWPSVAAELNLADAALSDVVGYFMLAGVDNRPWVRMLAWAGLSGDDTQDDDPDGSSHSGPADDAFFVAMVEDIRRRQRDGQLAADLDPATVLLVLFAAALAPTLLPQIVRRITGRPPGATDFLTDYRDQLRVILDHLAG